MPRGDAASAAASYKSSDGCGGAHSPFNGRRRSLLRSEGGGRLRLRRLLRLESGVLLRAGRLPLPAVLLSRLPQLEELGLEMLLLGNNDVDVNNQPGDASMNTLANALATGALRSLRDLIVPYACERNVQLMAACAARCPRIKLI